MKKLFSIFLALTMVLGLFGAAGVSALADEEDTQDGVTILFTGGIGQSVGDEEGLNFAVTAALKASYDGSAVLVDAGGFDVTAASIMEQAGYALVVPDEELEGSLPCISMGIEGLSAGASISVDGVVIAFVGVVPMGEEEDTDTYYAAIQANVDMAAAAAGVDYIILLGQVDDAEALALNVTGIDAILTTGTVTGVGAVSAGESVDEAAAENETVADADDAAEEEAGDEAGDTAEDAGEEDAEDVEDTGDADAAETGVTVITVAKGFAAVGALTLSSEGVAASYVAAEDLDELDLTPDEEIAALEAAWLEALDGDTEDTDDTEDADATEDTGKTEDADDTEDVGDAEAVSNTEDTGDAEAVSNTEDTGDAEAVSNTEDTGDAEAVSNTEDTDDVEETSETTDTDETDETDETSGTDGTDGTEDTDETDETDDTDDTDDVSTDGTEETASSSDASSTTLASDTDADTNGVSTYEFVKGTTDLTVALEHAVSSIAVSGGNTLVEGSDYTLSEDGKTVTFPASLFNGWNAGTYALVISYSDGTADETIKIAISGEAPTETTAATDTPAPTATATPAAGDTPATGDTSPIALYVVILVVMAAALGVVIFLIVRKKK